MKISELKTGQGRVEVEGVVKKISDTRVFNKYGKELKVADAILEDESGAVKLALWNEDITRINVGDKVKITNGFVNEFQSEKQLTAGKFGKIEIIKDKDE
jgi:replication factor A1